MIFKILIKNNFIVYYKLQLNSFIQLTLNELTF